MGGSVLKICTCCEINEVRDDLYFLCDFCFVNEMQEGYDCGKHIKDDPLRIAGCISNENLMQDITNRGMYEIQGRG